MKKRQTEGGNSKTWRFFRAGGFDQVRIDTGEDLAHLGQLDRKLWVALACPIDNIHFDKETLACIDRDGDRRIRAEELVAATEWTTARLTDHQLLMQSADGIPATAINSTNDDGKKLAAACRSALSALGKRDDDVLTVADTERIEFLLAQNVFNGDGIITEACTENDSVRSCIHDIIVTLGSKTDRSGKPGVDADLVATFFSQITTCSEWLSESEKNPAILPFGTSTEAAATAFNAVHLKIDDFFARCRMAEFDERAAALLDNSESVFTAMNASAITDSDRACETLPLSRVTPGGTIPLGPGCNPAWMKRLVTFASTVTIPLLGNRDVLGQTDWLRIKSVLDPWFSWQQRKPNTMSDSLGANRMGTLLAGTCKDAVLALITSDAAESPTFESLADIEKLVRLTRDLHRICINFVNFKEFYSGKSPAMFQAGTLFLDQRSCLLCIKVEDVSRHSAMAAMAGACLVYCDCRRRGGAEKMTIVAAFTNGDSENLIVGRNGIFYDRSGADWDAMIIKIIENPISMKQAFWLPYKNLVRMIESSVAKRATAAETESNTRLDKTTAGVAVIDKTKPPAMPIKVDVGTVAALGVAAGALGTFLATLMGYAAGIIRLGPFAIAGAFIGLLLLISGPSLILAYIKLRKRNLGPILDAGGWAINAKACINVPFGAALTKCATLPPGSQRDLFDPYAEKKSIWPKIIIAAFCIWVAIVAIDKSGMGDRWMKKFPDSKRNILNKLFDSRNER